MNRLRKLGHWLLHVPKESKENVPFLQESHTMHET